MNTIHVEDVVKAIWFLCSSGKSGDIFNLADKSRIIPAKLELKTGFLKSFRGVNMSYILFELSGRHEGFAIIGIVSKFLF